MAGADPSSMTVPELKAELKKLGEATTGRKPDLVKRLVAALGDGGDEEKEVEEEEEEEEAPAPKGKKRGAAATAEAPVAKKAKAPAAAPAKKGGAGKQRKLDQHCSMTSATVVGDWDCMLNQTNLSHNNNKYYVIQLVQSGASYYVWTRWGRVGESGQNKLLGSFDLARAEKEFCKKFREKSANDWYKRDNFVSKAGKYTLIEMAEDSDEEEEMATKLQSLQEGAEKPAAAAKNTPAYQPSKLDKPTQDLVKLIFNNDMFKEAMASFDIDVKKMPLGALSKTQITKGFAVLEEIEAKIKAGTTAGLSDLCSRFYTLIPHDFGRRIPPVIKDQETLQKKKDMLNVLGDIEIAQTLQKQQKAEKKEESSSAGPLPEHPYDVQYKTMDCELRSIKPGDSMFKLVEEFIANTGPTYKKLKLLDLFEVDRHGEDKRFDAHKGVANRKLLWHGTNVAVVVAILKTGLRIMPHSGGRVGRGIYFASENSKSAGYVGTSGNTGIMFLNEVVLGKEHHINKDDSTLRAAPTGCDCVIAKGWTEPDPKNDKQIKIDGNDVVVPVGKPIKTQWNSNSSFSQSEYLVYKESQARIRYLCKIQF